MNNKINNLILINLINLILNNKVTINNQINKFKIIIIFNKNKIVLIIKF